MNARIQKLCKRLSRFTLEEIALISELDEIDIESVLKSLINKNLLIKNDNNYIYNNIEKEAKLKKRLPKMFEYHSQETIDMIIKCFCAEIPSAKVGLILKPQENCICSFNLFFRETLFQKQEQELLNHFRRSSQKTRLRTFFDKTLYFYYYEDHLYVSTKCLTDKNARSFSDKESRQFKIIYSFLYRRLNHNTHEHYLQFYIAEQIWRHKKEFQQLKNELYSQLFG